MIDNPYHIHECPCGTPVMEESVGHWQQNRIKELMKKPKVDTTTWLCGPPPANGQYQKYPGRFIYNLKKYYPEFISEETLHMFSGSSDFGTTTDFREETGADIIADYTAIPRDSNSFANVLCDPPYADHWQNQWHGDLPKPKHILKEASRLVKAGGLIGILHIIIIPAYKEFGVERIAIHPILSGPNNALRCFNVFRKLEVVDDSINTE